MNTTTYLHPGKRLGTTYELESLVGTGQFGQVWRAKKFHDSAETTVALKVPLDPHRGEEVLMADGQHMLHIPKHPGVVSVQWQGRVGKIWVVEMEFVNGEPLSVLMADEARWSRSTFDDIIRWFIGVAEALAFLHGQSIAHGDIKPDNLMIDEQSGRLKITDFGTSRRLTDNLIRTFRHAGAWAYQAPEIQKSNQRGAVSDLFSVGAVLYHVLAGRLPRSTIHELLTSSPITRPRQFNTAISPQLDQLVMDLLKDEPEERLPSAAELQRRLTALLAASKAEKVPSPIPLPTGTGYLDRATALLAEGNKEDVSRACLWFRTETTGEARYSTQHVATTRDKVNVRAVSLRGRKTKHQGSGVRYSGVQVERRQPSSKLKQRHFLSLQLITRDFWQVRRTGAVFSVAPWC